jgi:hypothetical protein
MRCVKKKLKDQKVEIKSRNYEYTIPEIYHLYIVPTSNESRVNEDKYRKFYYKSKVWCVNNKNGTIITRRDGKVCILGNSKGQAADMVGYDNKKLWDVIVKLNKEGKLNWTQLIDEKNLQWVHIGIDPKNLKN